MKKRTVKGRKPTKEDTRLREFALIQAISSSNGPENPDGIVKRAEIYLAYLKGETASPDSASTR